MKNHFTRERLPKKISVIIPVFNEEENIEVVYEAIKSVLNSYDWELIFIDDGSNDSTFEKVWGLSLADAEGRVHGLSFSRNFGHQNALLAGMAESDGEVVVTMDGDMQHPPDLIPKLIEKWQEGYNIVHTTRIATNTGFFKRITSDWFYKIFSTLCGVKLEGGQSDFRLVDRKAADVLSAQSSGPLFFRGLVHSIGFRHTHVSFEVGKRFAGKSKYSVSKMLRFATHGITAFSTLPLHIGIRIGFLTSLFAFAELVYIFALAITGKTVPGWASLAGLVSLLFGISFVLVGFLGIYIGHIFQRIQSNPLYIVENRTDQKNE